MQNIKAVILDFDNTFYSHFTKRVPESAARAVRALAEKGIPCWICTGRSLPELKLFDFWDLPVEGIIAYSGQLAYRKGVKILDRPFTGELLDRMTELFRRKEFAIKLDEEDRIYCNMVDDTLRSVMAEINTPVPEVRDWEGAPLYMVTVVVPPEELEEREKLFDGCTKCVWHAGGVDNLPPNGGKAGALRDVLRQLELTPDQIMAFGDNDNDAEMLEYAGIGVAMGNGTAAAKAAADWVTGHIDEDGLYNALVHFDLLD